MPILFILFGASLVIAGLCLGAVMDDFRRSLPRHLDEGELRILLGAHVWGPLVSDEARRQYVWSYAWAIVAFLLLSGILWRDHPIGAAVAFGMAVVTTISIAWQS
jgi:hypothetical protein